MAALLVRIKRAIIPQDLKGKIQQLTEETKELALAYLIGTYVKNGKEGFRWNPGMFHGDLAMTAWETLGLKFKAVPMNKKESAREGNSSAIPAFMKKMDWKLLAAQKRTLITMQARMGKNNLPPWTKKEYETLEGMLNFLDAVQDYAVDEMGLSSKDVYRITRKERMAANGGVDYAAPGKGGSGER